jgi:hypothetical protein
MACLHTWVGRTTVSKSTTGFHTYNKDGECEVSRVPGLPAQTAGARVAKSN